MPLYTYRCTHGHETEALKPVGVTQLVCDCGETAARQAVNSLAFTVAAGADWSTVIRDGGQVRAPLSEVSYRDDYRRFREASEQLADSSTAPLFAAAKRKAKRLQAAGVRDSRDI